MLHPNIHLNDLSRDLCVLTNYKTYKTKKLNRYQKEIVQACNGINSVEDIKLHLAESDTGKALVNQVDQYIDNLIAWGYLTWSPKKVDRLNSTLTYMNPRLEENQELSPSSMLAVTISILDSCVLKCGYCSQNAPNGKSILMPFEKVKEILDDAYDLGAKYFGVFGGEPMMHPDVYDIIQYAYLKGYKHVQLFTRGTLIDEAAARKLHSVGIHSLQLTADSHIPEKYDSIVGVPGTFMRMYRAVYYLLGAGIEIIMKIIATKENIADIPDMVRYFTEIGIVKFDIEAVVPVGRAGFSLVPSLEELTRLQQQLDELKAQYSLLNCGLSYLNYGKPKQCSGGIGTMIVFADGDTGPCDKSYFIKDQLSFGNIYQQNLKEIWSGRGPALFRNLRNKDAVCQACSEVSSCLGGCVLNSYIQNDVLGPDPMCSKISGKTQGIFPID